MRQTQEISVVRLLLLIFVPTTLVTGTYTEGGDYYLCILLYVQRFCRLHRRRTVLQGVSYQPCEKIRQGSSVGHNNPFSALPFLGTL